MRHQLIRRLLALLRHADGRDYVRFLEKTGSRGQTDKMTRMMGWTTPASGIECAKG
jgi:hypothetical protein